MSPVSLMSTFVQKYTVPRTVNSKISFLNIAQTLPVLIRARVLETLLWKFYWSIMNPRNSEEGGESTIPSEYSF